jgi:hypothetical protein
MTLVARGSDDDISAETLRVLAGLLGLSIPPEDTAALAASLAGQLTSADALDQLDLTDTNPLIEFDPRWHD